MNRQVIGRLADIHLCPTEFNKENLLKENVSGEIYVVGNTGLDNISKEGCEYNNQPQHYSASSNDHVLHRINV